MKCKSFLIGFLCSLLATPLATEVHAQSDINIVRDAEIESTLHLFARPIFLAAHLRPEDVTIVLIESQDINAFVAGGMNMFIYTGLILATDTPAQLVGVMAHETGHIAGGHLARRGEGEENATIAAIFASAVGLAASVMARGGSGAGGALAGGEAIGQANILSFTRTQEASADQAGITFLERSGQSPVGLYEFLQKLEGQEALPENRQVEYTRTHPLTADRVEAVKYAVDQWSLGGKAPLVAPPDIQTRYDRMKAKLMGYLYPAAALRKFKNDNSVTGRYGRAYALYRSNQAGPALALMDGLIAAEPTNPYFEEFKGQMLFETGKVAEAVEPYRQAVKLAPTSGLIKEEAAHAMLESNNPAYNDEAISYLTDALRDESDDPFVHRLLATAFGRRGDEASVHLNLAQEASLEGDIPLARREAKLSMGISPVGTRTWIEAQDLISANKPIKSDGSGDQDKDKKDQLNNASAPH